jgi:hypothetical protein
VRTSQKYVHDNRTCARQRKISWFAKIPIYFDFETFSLTEREILVKDFWEFFYENGNVWTIREIFTNMKIFMKTTFRNGSMTH